MMTDNRIRRRCIFVVVLILFSLAALAVHLQGGIDFVPQSELVTGETATVRVTVLETSAVRESMCLGVPILTKAETAEWMIDGDADYSQTIFFGGEPAAVDQKQKCVYIPQEIGPDTSYMQLKGELTIGLERCRLYFAADDAFDNLADAVRQGYGFRLLIQDTHTAEWSEYHVVFTTLPVLRLEGGFSHFDKDGENALTGQLCLFTPFDPDLQGYSIKSSRASWHLRGATTSRQPKKSWKVDLIDGQRANTELAFLGLGSDDDWILNSMSLDDTRMKEKLAMDVWNHIAAETLRNDQMSEGRYVELVRNGQYCGVYLLQRRIDEVYLQLDAQDVLFKGLNTWAAADPSDGYEIEYSPLNDRDTFELMRAWSNQTDLSFAEPDNFVDAHLFVQWGSMQDNSSYNNMYYVLKPDGNGYRMYMVPWDTDYSMGVLWYNNFFDYQLDMSVSMQTGRVEFDAMKARIPELDRLTAERWFALRENAFSEENIFGLLDSYYDILSDSGALERDRAAWGEFYGGQDSFENLHQYFERRLQVLDEQYRSILQ